MNVRSLSNGFVLVLFQQSSVILGQTFRFWFNPYSDSKKFKPILIFSLCPFSNSRLTGSPSVEELWPEGGDFEPEQHPSQSQAGYAPPIPKNLTTDIESNTKVNINLKSEQRKRGRIPFPEKVTPQMAAAC